ncbi:MAG: hypothetical protein M3M94_00145 [Actinomycetota bacterium]|nr:hypothetical protein [Actinomycetota bacterium]
MAELFSPQELEEIERRAHELASEHESDAGLRAALQLLAEAAGNLLPKVRFEGARPSDVG